MRFIIICLFQLATFASSAQQKMLKGSVQDSTGQFLSNISVTLLTLSDSFSTKTNSSGQFMFQFNSATSFHLKIAMVEYEKFTKTYSSAIPSEDTIIIDPIIISVIIKELQEIILTSSNPVTVKEDTIEYKAEAYKVREGAVVEDVLRKLPGITVSRDGVVTAQGKEVTRVRVNGKDYFGGEVLTATRNLPANVVENIQVIEDYGEKGKQTGIKEGEADKVLNINLKKGKENGSFGNANVVAGTRNRYLVGVSANNFNGDRQISMLGSINNTNSNSFEFSSGARGNNNRSMSPGAGDRGSVGVSQYGSLGFNYRNEWGKKISSYGSYSLANRENTTVGTSFLQDINTANISSIQSTNTNYSRSNNHCLSWHVEYRPDTLNYIKVSPFISGASSEASYQGNSLYTKPLYTTQNVGNSNSSEHSPSWGTEIYYVRKFKKPGRNFSVGSTINHTNRDQKRNVNNAYTKIDSGFSPPLSTYTEQNQMIGNDNGNTSTNVRLSFVEPLKKSASLEFSYIWNRSFSETNREVQDVDQFTGEKVKNFSQSNVYNYRFVTNRFGVSFFKNKKKYNYSVGISGQPAVLAGRDIRRDINTRNSNFNLIPSARFVYKLSRNQSLTASYGGSSREPGYTQLQPVSDSSNLKTIMKGNPNLKPEFTNRFRLQYNRSGHLSGKSLFANLSFDQTQNRIVTARVNDANGTGRTNSYLNTDGFYAINGNISITQPLAKKHFVLSFNTSSSFDNNISFTDNQKNIGHNWTFRPELLLRIDLPDKMDINIGGGYTYNKNTTRYTTSSYTSKVQNLYIGVNGKNYFLKDWTAGYDLTKNMYFGYLRNFNTNRTLLSLFVERRLLKNNKVLVRVQGFDLFNQNTGISRSVTGTTISDIQSNRLSRYFLVSFNYRLQKFGGR